MSEQAVGPSGRDETREMLGERMSNEEKLLAHALDSCG